jgi:hypothetical protein
MLFASRTGVVHALWALAKSFLKKLRDVLLGNRIDFKCTLVHSAYKEVSMQRSIGFMYMQSTLKIAQLPDRQFMAGCAAPLQHEAHLHYISCKPQHAGRECGDITLVESERTC